MNFPDEFCRKQRMLCYCLQVAFREAVADQVVNSSNARLPIESPNAFHYREMTETMREEERVKKQISRCIKMLFLGIIMCLGMALSVHAEGSGQFFNFEPRKVG